MVGQFIDTDVGVVGKSQLNGLIEREAQLAIHDIVAQMFRTGKLREHRRGASRLRETMLEWEMAHFARESGAASAQEWKSHTG